MREQTIIHSAKPPAVGQPSIAITSKSLHTPKHSDLPAEEPEVQQDELDFEPVHLQQHELHPELWLDADPLLEVTPATHITDAPISCNRDSSFFQLKPCQDIIDMEQQQALLAEGLQCINKLADPTYPASTEYAEPDVQWQARMLTAAPNPEAFKTGRLRTCAPVLQTLLSSTDTLTRTAKTALKWVNHGIKLSFVPVQHASHAKAPMWKKRLQIVRRMLTKAAGSDKVDQLLSGSEPARVQFPTTNLWRRTSLSFKQR